MARLLQAALAGVIPQAGVRLNLAHPAARWCSALITFPNGIPVDWVNRRIGSSWGTRPVPRGHLRGMAADNVAGGGVGGGRIDDAAGQSLYTPQNYTHLCVARVTAVAGDWSAVYSTSSSDGSILNSGIQNDGSSNQIGCYHGSGDSANTGLSFTGNIVDSTWHAWAVAAANVPARVLWRDGLLLASFGSGGVAPNSITGGRLLWHGDRSFNTSQYFTRGQVALHAVFQRRLPDALLAAVTRNPLALIAP
ncbi:MAG TPA: hypothetical protein P5024_11465 [Burkholderiaceae bacterium]|nr:hypothetical protein [Rubrivivax sp.]HRZ02166.1 hypothetical protein [Burkholderiaceae bacterium]HRZ59902.1 hypothetical protein [Rubrivivax sp.]